MSVMQLSDRDLKVIEAVTEKRFGDLFDPDFQTLEGYFPPEPVWRAYFGSDTRFQAWRHGMIYKILRFVTESSYPEDQKFHILREFYRAIGEKPEIERLRRPKRRRRRK